MAVQLNGLGKQRHNVRIEGLPANSQHNLMLVSSWDRSPVRIAKVIPLNSQRLVWCYRSNL